MGHNARVQCCKTANNNNSFKCKMEFEGLGLARAVGDCPRQKNSCYRPPRTHTPAKPMCYIHLHIKKRPEPMRCTCLEATTTTQTAVLVVVALIAVGMSGPPPFFSGQTPPLCSAAAQAEEGLYAGDDGPSFPLLDVLLGSLIADMPSNAGSNAAGGGWGITGTAGGGPAPFTPATDTAAGQPSGGPSQLSNVLLSQVMAQMRGRLKEHMDAMQACGGRSGRVGVGVGGRKGGCETCHAAYLGA